MFHEPSSHHTSIKNLDRLSKLVNGRSVLIDDSEFVFDKKAVKQTEETNLTAPDSRTQSQVMNRIHGLRGVSTSDQKDNMHHFERDLVNSNSIQNLSQEQYIDLNDHEEQRNV